MRRSDRERILAALSVAALLALPGCEDDSAAKAEEGRKKAAAEKAVKFVEDTADDPKQFTEVMKQAAKARVLAWGDNALLKRVEDATDRARTARLGQLDQLWNVAHERATAALAATDPQKSEKDCSAALQGLDSLAPAVAGRGGAKVDEDRKLLVERIDAARRANEVIAKAKDLGEESGVKARAFVKSFDIVPSLKASPFRQQVMALLATLPETGGSAGAPAASGGGEEIIIFDGSSDAQFTYFERQHDWTWKVPKPPEEPLLFGDNTESTSDPSTIWLGDETWGDLIVDIQFNVGDVGLQFHARVQDETTYDLVSLPDVKKGEWGSVRIELRGQKATIRYNGEKAEVTLSKPKGKFGITLPPMALVKVRSVKLRLLDKDAKRPQMRDSKPADDDDKTDETKKKKKKKKPAAGEGGEPDGGEKK